MLQQPMADRTFGFDTRCLHAGQIPDAETGSRAVPIYQTVAHVFDSPEHAASLFNLQTFGNVYARLSNPTLAVLEERVASLEGGRAAVATASGMAAQMVAMLNLCESGDEIVAARTLYGGTHTQLDVNFRKLGIATSFVNADDPADFARVITPKTKLLYAETLGNPSLNVLDIAAVAEVAASAGLPLFIDNTFASPYLCRPFEWGAAVVLHSATKFLGGHGTTMGGLIVESGKFNYANGRFATMTEPSAGYHGVRFYETFGDFGFTAKCRMEGLRTFGPALSPFNAFLLLQGIETLSLRMERHCASALAVAQWLSTHPRIAWVNYPGLPDNRNYALAKKYLPKGAGAVLTFGIKGGAAAGQRLIERVQFLSHLANVGDAKTLIIHPASTTHRQMGEEQQIAAGVPPDLIRLSVGLESVDDILWDLDQAMQPA
jgi:O-acetylhomoserine (thiol)-lyase